ncbi:TatD related deoxyribonuclease [Trypanosoma theileri]|uniref:TatD related deoxyribonuclease n=1 Tax=Trypanosoma theileri TaxID=67003 RepID=A0A1X0P426_9TRYP|nr:TatD related deoxyribonuclease [Trypanosoma theileri]ORC91687.1 TatD related deoxyribonuclease [Trypanosoma theileri]
MKGPGGPYLVDVALNLTDCVFRGVDWKGRRVHEDNFEDVLRRAEEQNVKKMIITGTSLAQCVKAIKLCRRYPSQLLCTVGIHPAHSAEFMLPLDWASVEEAAKDDVSIQIPQPPSSLEYLPNDSTSDGPARLDTSKTWQYTEDRLKKLIELVEENRDVVVAVGEIGLDYAELSYCPKDVQQEYFLRQLRAFRTLKLPFLFHSRDCGTDFVRILEEERQNWPTDLPFTGVVHSYNGTPEEQERLLAMSGIYFSINGTAFREKQIADQICQIPLERIMLETDSPWCDIRKQHYGAQFVRTHFPTNPKEGQQKQQKKPQKPFDAKLCNERRNEPCHLRQVLEAYVGALRSLNHGTNNENNNNNNNNNNNTDLQNITEEEVMQRVYSNCATVFSL